MNRRPRHVCRRRKNTQFTASAEYNVINVPRNSISTPGSLYSHISPLKRHCSREQMRRAGVLGVFLTPPSLTSYCEECSKARVPSSHTSARALPAFSIKSNNGCPARGPLHQGTRKHGVCISHRECEIIHKRFVKERIAYAQK